MLFIGAVNGNADYFIASALFSIASYLGQIGGSNGFTKNN